jgi:hypothetical protein
VCGDLDEEDSLAEALYTRFRFHAAALQRKRAAESREAPAEGIAPYLDKLFGDALARCLRDTEASEADRYELLSAQPLVFARLAGFLAAHASLQEDPLRRVLEAMMHGYAEAERMVPEHDHDHDHDPEGHGHGAHGHAHSAHDHHH